MAEAVNGYITVQTGLVGAVSVSVRPVPRGRRLNDAELRKRVVRLRHEGWSYRRIAATLELRYAAVAEILDGPTIWVGDYREVVPALEISRVSPERSVGELSVQRSPPSPQHAAASDEAIEAILIQHARLTEKVDALLRAAEFQRHALNRLETSIVETIRVENMRLTDRILGGIKTLFSRLLPLGPRRNTQNSGD